MKRAVIFAHYDKDGIVDPYVLYYLEALKSISDHIVCVSTASLSQEEVKKLSASCNRVIVRENEGYDFMSYKRGLQTLEGQQYEEILFCNDSVYGPIFDLEPIFSEMTHADCDFWGMTESSEIAYHLQSYFMLFKKSAIESDAFQAFWEEVTSLENKEEIISRYEVGLTTSLQNSGLKARSYAMMETTPLQKLILFGRKLTPGRILKKLISLSKGSSSVSSLRHINITLTFWEDLLTKAKMPFIKVSLLRDNPNNVPLDHIYDVIASHSSYDTELIKRHQARIGQKVFK